MDTDICANTELNGLSLALPKLLRIYDYMSGICNLSVCLWHLFFSLSSQRELLFLIFCITNYEEKIDICDPEKKTFL
jgi:hypothetical protein